jgi:hypothetical protein
MQADLHYYVTFIAARAAGWGHEDAAEIALAAHYVDCSGDPDSLPVHHGSSKTEMQRTITCVDDLMVAKENMRTMPAANQLVWSAFHFLPAFDQNADSRYDYVYDNRRWRDMTGTGVNRRIPDTIRQGTWNYRKGTMGAAPTTPRAMKLAMRCFPNSPTIEAMTADTVARLATLTADHAHHGGIVATAAAARAAAAAAAAAAPAVAPGPAPAAATPAARAAALAAAAAPAAAPGATATAAAGYMSDFEMRMARAKALALIGVRLHVLADSFSHAGFAGTTSSINKEDGTRLLLDPTDTTGEGVTLNYAVGSHGVAKWMATGHAMAGALPDMPGLRYCFKSPKLDVWIYKDNPTAYKHATTAVHAFLVQMKAHAPASPVPASDAATQALFATLLAEITGGAAGPIFLTEPNFQFPMAADRTIGYAFRHITSWGTGSSNSLWEYTGTKADDSLQIRCTLLLAKIRAIVPKPAAENWHDIRELLVLKETEVLAFEALEKSAGLGGTRRENKNTEYSIVRRVRAHYYGESPGEGRDQHFRLRAVDWAATTHHDWFTENYHAPLNISVSQEALEARSG